MSIKQLYRKEVKKSEQAVDYFQQPYVTVGRKFVSSGYDFIVVPAVHYKHHWQHFLLLILIVLFFIVSELAWVLPIKCMMLFQQCSRFVCLRMLLLALLMITPFPSLGLQVQIYRNYGWIFSHYEFRKL